MAGDSERSQLKSAYELALERLESQGIARPDESALSDAVRESVAAERNKAEAKLAELEILHQKSARDILDPVERTRAEEEYRSERRRVEERRDREIDRLRSTRSEP